jgi:hypothetical protein
LKGFFSDFKSTEISGDSIIAEDRLIIGIRMNFTSGNTVISGAQAPHKRKPDFNR